MFLLLLQLHLNRYLALILPINVVLFVSYQPTKVSNYLAGLMPPTLHALTPFHQ